jgi:hypothetical protein
MISLWGRGCRRPGLSDPTLCPDDDDNDVYLNKSQRKVLQNLLFTCIMQTSQYGISKGNISTNNKSYRYDRITQR